MLGQSTTGEFALGQIADHAYVPPVPGDAVVFVRARALVVLSAVATAATVMQIDQAGVQVSIVENAGMKVRIDL